MEESSHAFLTNKNDSGITKPSIVYGTHVSEDFPVTKRRVATVRAQRYVQIFLAEYIAATLLLFGVCLGCMDGTSSTPLSPIQSPLTSGFVVAILVASFAHISGAHLNPAVTACFLSLGKIDVASFFVYIVAEMLGAVTGVGLLRGLIPGSILEKNPGQCETVVHADMSIYAAVVFEFFLTSMLVLLVCSLLDGRNSSLQDSAAVKFGLAVAGLSYAGGNLTGASMNPARTFGPVLWSGAWSGHWVYWVGPMAAGFLVPKLYKFLFEKDLSKGADE